ncbi:uncharacterized protein Bfra_008824 [Botrytis fragariae]|uniref:F-box domain-containing protein n=1 Tax=Botrytis fragariae TaxID=1964551 RepID=A0A8H6EH81_9HELO|nr:uncharacterized protein Bfra_008824 [Botrytis fragariae]KAF5871800.1 hypothetical protein Bfra_008824 [Botrytis fragariae]
MDSNVWSIPWPRELPVVVRSLQKLPREIVHQVLSDLPVIKILSILSWQLPYLDECVLSHIVYGRLFSSQGEISHASNHYRLYREMCWFRRWPPADAESVFARSPQMLLSNWVSFDLLISKMRRLIRVGLYINEPDFDLLVKYGRPFPCITGIELDENGSSLDLKLPWDYWNWIKHAKMELNKRKSDQIRFSAHLMEKYPRVLKRPLDPSQGALRPNTTHTVVMLERLAMRTLKNRNLSHYWDHHQGLYKSGRYVIELVPYDRYLQLLLDTLAKYPLDIEVTGLEETLANVSLHNGCQETTLEGTELATILESDPNDFMYPENITASLRVVLKGLMYIYTEPPLTIPRIQWEPPKDDNSSGKWPRFFVDKGIHEHPHFEYPCANQKIKPYDKREYEWLAAFIEVVTWIELNIGPAKEDF